MTLTQSHPDIVGERRKRTAARRSPRPAGPSSNGSSPTLRAAQRARLLAAALQECDARGAANVTVAGVAGAAGVARRTFYQCFPDVRRCVLASMEQCLDGAAEVAAVAFAHPNAHSERLRAGLAALLEHFERRPDVGRMLVVETLRAGPEAAALRRRTVSELAAVIDRLAVSGSPGAAVCLLSGEAAVGAVLSVLHDRLISRGRPRLTALLPELMCVIVAPYLGPAAARRQLQRGAEPPPRRRESGANPVGALPMRLTYRTMRVLVAIGGEPGLSNREVATAAGIVDQGQASKLLTRLHRLGLIENLGGGGLGVTNAWRLTATGREIERQIDVRARGGRGALSTER